MKWFKRNYRTILLISIPILLSIDIAIRLLFHFRLTFDANNFNNIVTPIGAILSTILFFIALWFAIKQNEIILSQNIKPHIEDRLKKIAGDFNVPSIKMNAQTISTKSLIPAVIGVLSDLRNSPELQADINAFIQGGATKPEAYFRTRNYFPRLEDLYSIYTSPIGDFFSIQMLIREINSSSLIELDKKYYKEKIREDFIKHYLDFFDQNDFDQTINLVPMIDEAVSPVTPVPFQQFHRTQFRKYYDFFKKHLG